MMKKKSILLGMVTTMSLLYAGNTNSSDSTVKLLKKAYNTGIYDTLSVMKHDLRNFNKTDKLKGYAVLIDTQNLALTDIIKYEAFAIRIGLNPKLINNQLIFVVHERKADADYIKNMIMRNSKIKPKVEYINTKAKEQNIISTYANSDLPQKVLLVYVKEKTVNKNYYNNNNAQTITLSGDVKLHFVNRILDTEGYNKKCKSTKCKPKINTNPASVKKTTENVEKTISKKEISLKGKNFFQLSKIIANYGVITHNNRLIIGKHIFKRGDKLNKNHIVTYIDFNKGVIVIDNISALKVKKESSK